MIIKVTQDDIRFGKQCNATDCPIARAVARARQIPLGHVTICPAGRNFQTPKTKDYYETMSVIIGPDIIPLPQIAKDFVQTFDEGGKAKVTPLEFEI